MTSARHGGVLGRFLVVLVVVSLCGALAWATLANHRASGTWSFHPLDPAWWSPRQPNGGNDDPLTDLSEHVRRLAGKAGEALWGPGGLLERSEQWWNDHATPAPPPATPAPTGGEPPAPPPTAPAPTSVRGLLEQRFSSNERRFAEGIALAKRARPTLGDDVSALAGRIDTLRQAHACFTAVEHDLGEAIPAYEALPGHDPTTLANARQLRGFARQMQELTRLPP
jgi:hypothetical protein